MANSWRRYTSFKGKNKRVHKKLKARYRSTPYGATTETIMRWIMKLYPDIPPARAREWVMAALDKGEHSGFLVKRDGRWWLASPGQHPLCVPGEHQRLAALFREYGKHVRSSQVRARRALTSHLRDVETFIARRKRRDASEDRPYTEVLQASMVGALIQRYLYERRVSWERGVRQLTRCLRHMHVFPSQKKKKKKKRRY